MMRLINNKKNVKVFSIVIAAIFIIGIAALAYTQMATPGGSPGASNVGVIDISRMSNNDNPLYVKAAKEFTEYRSKTYAEAQAKIDAAQDDYTKSSIQQETSINISKKQEELNKELEDKTMEAAKAVGEAKGLTVVLPKNLVLYGGVDITDQVLKKLSSDAK